MQISLFDNPLYSPDQVVDGLAYVPDFITPQQEASLISTIDAQDWLTDLKRRVQHYGWRYDYKAKRISEDLRLGELPDWLAGYCKKLHIDGYFSQMPDQVIINEYLAGQGITPHIDCVPCFGDTIASLSLGSPCVMELSKDSQKRPLLLEPRSLVVLSGEARYRWKHAIARRKTDKINGISTPRERRISLTFRTTRYG